MLPAGSLVGGNVLSAATLFSVIKRMRTVRAQGASCRSVTVSGSVSHRLQLFHIKAGSSKTVLPSWMAVSNCFVLFAR